MLRERLRWLEHVLQMKNDRLQKIFVVGQPFRVKQKVVCPQMESEDIVRKDLREIGNFLAGCKEGGFE